MIRKYILSLSLLSLSLTCVNAQEKTPYSGSRIFWDTTTRTTVFKNGGYSRIIQLQDGRLMAVAESGGICVSYSSNSGSSWSTPERIVSNPSGVSKTVPDLIQLSDGTIIVGYNPRPIAPYSEERKFGIRCIRSTDNGKTWGDEIFVYDASYTFDDGCWEPSFLELPSGEVQLYYSDEGPYTTNNDQNISICRSFDKGLTWGEPEKISYRSGSRDGMPCAVILNDGKTIAVSIEDNGWPGVGDFFPTIVRCPLETNWHNYYVTGNSANRSKTLDFNFCPNATGGAPYLRVLPQTGETILSYQSNYQHNGYNQMYVAVGNEDARDFKSLQHPFRVGDNDQVLWNSLCIIDTGVVVAVGGVNSSIEMIKGYPVNKLQAPYGRPALNGVYAMNKGYLRPQSNQVTLGVENGTRFIADFAYDNDSLYFFGRAADRTPQIQTGSYGDGISLCLDMKNRSAQYPKDGEYKIFFRRDTTYAFYKGSDEKCKWVADNSVDNIHLYLKSSKTAYVVEAAVPWSALGCDKVPEGQTLRVNVEMQNNMSGTSSIVTETIPDAKSKESWTWMELYLQPHDNTAISSVSEQSTLVTLSSHDNIITASCDEPVRLMSLYSPDGSLISSVNTNAKTVSCETSAAGLIIVRCLLASGKVATGKVMKK